MLLGLVAVAAPILAHLLRRQRLPRQTLPTIAFLHRIHATRAARLRVVDMLLLLLRVLLVLIVILVAAQPYRVVQSSVTDRQHALAIVFDDSLSMSAIHQGSTLIERAASLAKRQLRRVPQGSEVSVVLAGKPPRVWVRRSAEVEMASDAFEDIEERSIRANALCDAVRAAVELLLESDLAERRLVVFSDFTQGAHANECEWPTRGVSIGLEQVATPNADNRWIRSVEVTGNRDSEKGLQLDARVSGTNTSRTQSIRLRQKGQETHTSPVDWTGEEGVAALTLPAGSTDAVVEMRLDPDDVLPADNVKGVLLGSDTIHVLLVDGDPHPDPR
ncbi:MAG: VWA domain-containing protein, partial [Myxococcales bacterium]|nr:VWA domain-containing protein [Myxococcales bacterium]